MCDVLQTETLKGYAHEGEKGRKKETEKEMYIPILFPSAKHWIHQQMVH